MPVVLQFGCQGKLFYNKSNEEHVIGRVNECEESNYATIFFGFTFQALYIAAVLSIYLKNFP